MDVPGLVEEALEGEHIAAQVGLGGDDELFVTPTQTLVYRSDGLLSDETVETYPHDSERLLLSEGRRKATITLVTPLGDRQNFSVPANVADEVILPVLAGVLHANDVTDDTESVLHTYRFSELSLVITDQQLIKHVGEAVWDTDFEAYAHADVTGLDVEEGDVTTQVVLSVDGRPERIKTPKANARKVHSHLEEAIREYHNLDPQTDLNTALAPTDDAESPSQSSSDPEAIVFEDQVDPLDTSGVDTLETGPDSEPASTDPTQSSTATAASDPSQLSDAGFTPADAATPDLQEELAELRSAIEEQNKLLNRQQETLEQLIEELRRGR